MIESEVKAMDIVIFLQNLGYNPIKINSRYAMFHVLYCNSNHPTLRINRIENSWLDYSTGRKGNIIELGKLVYQIDNAKTNGFRTSNSTDSCAFLQLLIIA